MWVLANLLVQQPQSQQQGGGGSGTGAGVGSASCQITDLDISENKLGDVGARALGLVLNDNKSLLRLVAEGNAIGDGGCVALAGGLGYNATLEELRLSQGANPDNQLTEVGVEALMAAVERQRQQQRRRQQSLRICDVGDAAGAEQLQLVLQPPY